MSDFDLPDRIVKQLWGVHCDAVGPGTFDRIKEAASSGGTPDIAPADLSGGDRFDLALSVAIVVQGIGLVAALITIYDKLVDALGRKPTPVEVQEAYLDTRTNGDSLAAPVESKIREASESVVSQRSG